MRLFILRGKGLSAIWVRADSHRDRISLLRGVYDLDGKVYNKSKRKHTMTIPPQTITKLKVSKVAAVLDQKVSRVRHQ